MSPAFGLLAAATLLALCSLVQFASAFTYGQVNFTTVPSQGFVGSFAGPLYSPGNAVPTCSVLINTGLGTQIFIVARNISATDPNCTNLAALPLTTYNFIGADNKCTGPGEGYQFNYPVNVSGAAPPTGGQYYCVKFKNTPKATEVTYTQGYSADLPCPTSFSNASLIVSAPGNNAGYGIFYALQGAVFPPC